MFAGNKCSFFLKNHSASVVNLKRGHRGQRNLINSWDRRPCDHHQSTRLRPCGPAGRHAHVRMFCNESSVAVETSSVRGAVLAHGVTLGRPVTDLSALSSCSSQQGGAPVLQVHRGHIFTFIHRRKRGKNTIFILGEKITTVRRSRVTQEELFRFHGELNKV